MKRSKTIGALAATAALAAAIPAAAQADAVVCNEAQSSWKGTWTVTDSIDSDPPARHKDAAMPVGRGEGLVNAATRSPALAVCAPADNGGGGDTGDGDDGPPGDGGGDGTF